MNIQTIIWQKNKIRLIDQTRLPARLEYISVRTVGDLWKAIRTMKVRGAPVLGAAAALGMYLGVKDSTASSFASFSRELDRTANFLARSRPTARNLFWALERMCSVAVRNRSRSIAQIKKLLLAEANHIIDEDKRSCRRIGRWGAEIIRSGDAILTVCNAGILATVDYGTALGVLYRASADGKKIKVYSCETRPVLQGARLTTWELKKKGLDVTLICDSMAGTLMQQGKITTVIAGADRIASNGDTANKIGTYALAVLARAHRIPFYIAAPATTFDLSIASGHSIPIEDRPAREVTHLFFKKPIAPIGIKVYNPAFDITGHRLITALITDKGIIKPPYNKNIPRTLCAQSR
jgi:methylthioribose-1-phosphate isomerase